MTNLFFAFAIVAVGSSLSSPAAAKPPQEPSPYLVLKCEQQATSCLVGNCIQMQFSPSYGQCVRLCDRQRTRCLSQKAVHQGTRPNRPPAVVR
jgi:hypothetical protein